MQVDHIRTGQLPWAKPSGAGADKLPGWSWKNLHENQDGVSVSLWKLVPGGADEVHVHDDAEEHVYVLSGEFECGGVTYRAGDYMFRPVGVPHQSRSRTGAEILLVYVKCAGKT